MTESAPAPIGTVAHYNLLEQLESAGPGEIFRARDTRLGRTVTVRWLSSDFAHDADARRRFMEEARSLVALSHPNITTLFDVGEHDGRIYLVSEFLKGQSLRAEAAGRPMHLRRALELAIQIADAVAGAHAAGFVGGGFGPDSITVTTRGHAKIPVFDPGVHSGLDQNDSVARHVEYDSPEEVAGKPPDERSDIYSVGAILYEMLTMRRPVHRGSAAPSAANRHVPAVVDRIVLQAVAPNPDRRIQSAAALAAELRAVAATPEVRGDGEDSFGDAEQPANRAGQVLMLTVVILLGLGLLTWSLLAN
ncbi:MAG: serine/threonine-protein kinase [Acidobacteria bacterium]|nr:serine/threonine-protein kinase [Acidobacteriota bacterium]